MRTLLLVTVALAAPLVLWAVLPMPSSGAPPAEKLDDIDAKLQRKERQATRKRQREGVLTGDIAAYTGRIRALSGRLQRLRSRQALVTATLVRERTQLTTMQSRLRAERRRLTRLRARLVQARRTLAARLVKRYQSAPPDLVTVVLDADGFAQLLEDAEFMRRVSDQDERIIAAVRAARAAARRQTVRLGRMERRQRAVTAAIQARRDEVADLRGGLEAANARLSTLRAARTGQLRRVRVSRVGLQREIVVLRAAQTRIRRSLRRAQVANASAFAPTPKAAPVRSGAGGFVWPVDGTITSPFCERRSWESCHPGLDVGAPEGTPIRAAAAGTVVLLQPTAASGGYGNLTCVQHAVALSTCYAHQSRFGTAAGAKVDRGQVIGYVGNTGRSFGAHLHFEVRVNGSVVNPLNYL